MRRENANNSSDSVDPDQEPGESFLGRWSRRKQRARTVPEEETRATPGESQAPNAPNPPDAQAESQERALSDADMPPLDSLDADSDYKGFLSPGVSDALRNAALRKLFLSPKFNVVDGLDDYADDFTKFEPLGDIITADMRHQMELAEERAKKALEEDLAASTEDSAPPSERDHEPVEDDGGKPSAAAEDRASEKNGTAENDNPGDPSGDEIRHG